MNSYLNLVSGKTKTASAEPQYQEIDLSQISGADLLAGLEDGSIVLPEQEKVAEDEAGDFDLSGLSEEQLLRLAEELGGQEKVASDEAESWDAAGRIFARGFMDEIDGGAEIAGDMNIRDALEKQAGLRDYASRDGLSAIKERAGQLLSGSQFKHFNPGESIVTRAFGKGRGPGHKPTADSIHEARMILAARGGVAAGTGAGAVGTYKGIQAYRNRNKKK